MTPVAFHGEYGAYSEEAAVACFGPETVTRPYRSLRQVFRLVQDGSVEFGIVPVENSVEGSVSQSYDLLLEFPVKICGEVNIRIAHCLLGLPETRLEDVKVVFSHPQALGQCARFLEHMQVEAQPAYNTAGSAKMIKEKRIAHAAAIASERTAKIYGMKILKKHIEDYQENFTRFLVISTKGVARTGRDKTSIVFATRHAPGTLYAVLGELATRRINLTKIESRPVRSKPWEYYFFVDFQGHYLDKARAEALEAVKRSTTFLRVLGSYPQDQHQGSSDSAGHA